MHKFQASVLKLCSIYLYLSNVLDKGIFTEILNRCYLCLHFYILSFFIYYCRLPLLSVFTFFFLSRYAHISCQSLGQNFHNFFFSAYRYTFIRVDGSSFITVDSGWQTWLYGMYNVDKWRLIWMCDMSECHIMCCCVVFFF